ncbi:Zn-dependent peptidase ImmA, M78 family [Mameliella alba]|uniref:XRE family transcriptional regulator n=1 Tax=Mameliella alba TaxID=561184 RepID=UPI00088804D2|nr:XRE family transcriptional regulator [Mameliella alba]OWV47724.1 hypothetical protein CDZ96_11510 [Mameliella alba]PTR39894.1 Zn-dependent peptidase ImmA (M78 family) [Mameliella alba]GGF60657.1 hypothetical protein GCM10011319_22180 [Mameliella alba]SDD09415.1 Zn-dependent peptidase ImmA, M78 family [Mameliella alba]
MSAAGTQLPYNPRVLEWARVRTGMAVDEVAKKINVATQKIIDWESGKSTPTTRQGRMLAASYDRHFLEFFSDSIPQPSEVVLVPDYRTFKGKQAPGPKETRSMIAVQEWAEEQRLNALAIIEELGDRPPVFSQNLRFNLDADIETAAEISREAMGLSIDDQLQLKKALRYTFPEILRDKIEGMGVLVLKQSGITKLGARGICLFAEPLPVIIYGNESPGAQAFTLAHEFGHVLLGSSGISGQPRLGGKSGHKAIEDWCNRFASAFLAPKASIERALEKPSKPLEQFDTIALGDLAQMFAMSRHAMLIRLVNLGYVRPEFYWKTMRPLFLEEEENHKSFGRPPYYGKRYVNAKGRFYTGLVMSAWSGGHVTAHNAAEYMGIKNLEHLKDIREDYGF